MSCDISTNNVTQIVCYKHLIPALCSRLTYYTTIDDLSYFVTNTSLFSFISKKCFNWLNSWVFCLWRFVQITQSWEIQSQTVVDILRTPSIREGEHLRCSDIPSQAVQRWQYASTRMIIKYTNKCWSRNAFKKIVSKTSYHYLKQQTFHPSPFGTASFRHEQYILEIKTNSHFD